MCTNLHYIINVITFFYIEIFRFNAFLVKDLHTHKKLSAMSTNTDSLRFYVLTLSVQ